MLLIADECVDFTIVENLRAYGLDIFSIAEQEPSIADEDVLSIAVRKNAILITEDKDFGDLVFRLKLPHRGIILLRLSNIPNDKKAAHAAKIILEHISELPGVFAVYDGFSLRIRRG